MIKKITFSLAFIFTAVLIALAADQITGTWVGKLISDNDERALTYNLKADGEKLTGNVTSELGDLPIFDGKVAGENITFKVDLNGTVIPHEGTVSNDTLKLKLTVQGNSMEGKFIRKKL